MNLKKIGLFFMIMIMLTVPALAQEGTNSSAAEQEEKTAFVVNGHEVTVTEIDAYANLQGLLRKLSQTDQQFTRLLVTSEAGNDLINEYRKSKIYNENQKTGMAVEILLADEARERGLEWTQEEKDQFFDKQMSSLKDQQGLTDDDLLQAVQRQGYKDMDQYKDEMLKSIENKMLIQNLQESMLDDIEISEEDIKTYYNENKKSYEHGKQVKASHILVDEKETAEEVLNKVNNGGDFADLAHEYSTDKYSLENDGSLGYFEKADMVEPFSKAAFAMEPGEISDIVESKHGFHIIKVTDQRDAGTTPLSEVQTDIENELKQQKAKEEWNNILDKVIENMELDIKLN